MVTPPNQDNSSSNRNDLFEKYGYPVKLTKLEAARKQLKVAISLWFNEEDPASIHTLTGASWQIICDINHKKGNSGNIYQHADKIHPKLGSRLVKEPTNFLKHADRDPEGMIEFSPFLAEVLILDAIAGIRMLRKTLSFHEAIFLAWSRYQRPELIPDELSSVITNLVESDPFCNQLKNMPRKDYFNMMLDNLNSLSEQVVFDII